MDSERPIEKLLRTCATKRRQQAELPSELHPATRKLLQGEVTRQFGRDRAQASRPWWSALVAWPRLAWGTGLAVVLVAAGLVLLLPHMGKEPMRLARHDQRVAGSRGLATAPRLSETVADQLAPRPTDEEIMQPTAAKSLTVIEPPAAAPAPTAPSKDKAARPTELKMEASADFAMKESAAPSLSIGGAATNNLTVNGPLSIASAPPRTYGLPGGSTGERFGAAVSQPAALSVEGQASTDSSALGMAFRSVQRNAAPMRGAQLLFVDATRRAGDKGAGASFARTSAPVEAATTAIPAGADSVLVSFKVEQAGDVLRIIDDDGSVYSGHFGSRPARPAAPLAAPMAAPASLPATAAASGTTVDRKRTLRPSLPAVTATAETAGAYAFHVAGTNKTLNQKVDFTGTLWPITNAVQGKITQETAARVGGSAAPPISSWLENSRISGQALINGRQQVEVNAAPARP